MITNALTVAQKLLVAGRKEVLAVGLMVLSTLGMIHPANAQEVPISSSILRTRPPPNRTASIGKEPSPEATVTRSL
jgi:hypothetical protein